jgi:hypothetical protein
MNKRHAALAAFLACSFSMSNAQTNGFLKRAEKAFNGLSPDGQMTIQSAVINPKQIYLDENGRYVTGEQLLNKESAPQETDEQLSKAMAKGRSLKDASSK